MMESLERVTVAIAAFVKAREDLRRAAEDEDAALPNTLVFELKADEESAEKK